jgi:hypothetical protein
MSQSFEDTKHQFTEYQEERAADADILPIRIIEDCVSALLTDDTCRLGADQNQSGRVKSCSGACAFSESKPGETCQSLCTQRNLKLAKNRCQGNA